MPARVQIQIEASDAASGVFRAIASQFGELGKAASDFGDVLSKGNAARELYTRGLTDTSVSVEEVARAEELSNAATARFAETLATLAINGLRKAMEETMKYGEQVRNLQLISGATAEDTSRFIQVLDDYKISAEDAEAATRKLKDNGYTPTIDTLAKLSDAYLSIKNPAEQLQFVQDNLGRGGLKWIDILNKGSEAIKAQGAGISEHLILTQKMVDAVRQNEIAQDGLNDSTQSLALSIGKFLVPAQTEFMDGVNVYVRALEISGDSTYKQTHRMGDFTDAFSQATQEIANEKYALMENKVATDESAQTQAELNAQLEESTKYYNGLIGDIQSAQNATDNYVETQTTLKAKEADLTATRETLLDQLNKTEKAYGANSKAAQDLRGKIDGIDKDLGENASALKKNEESYQRWAAETVFAFAQARAAADGSISTMEGEVLVQAGEALGLFSKQTADSMREVNKAFDNLDPSNAQAVIATLQQQLKTLTETPYTVNINVAQSGTVPVYTPGATGSSGVVAQQTGGVVSAGNVYQVGEAGKEPFIPATNGRVIGHAEALHALTLGGSGGGTNYFYGAVTLAIGGDDAAGFMELR